MMVSTPDNNNRKTSAGMPVRKWRWLFIGSGILFMLLVWQVLSMLFPEFIIASPSATLRALGELASNGSLWKEFGSSLVRLMIGLVGGAVIGVTLGVLAGMNRRLQFFLEPMRWGLMTVPAIVISVLVMLWFGLGSIQVIIMTGIITMPINYVNTLEGMLGIDARILEMARVYKIPPRLRLTNIYLPGIGSSVMAGLTLASGIGVRASILAEFIGGRNGIGHNLFLSWTFLDTPALFAWILTAFALLGLVEFAVLKPIRDHIMRWKIKA
jgi:NitT/TauT family transport system permease protein